MRRMMLPFVALACLACQPAEQQAVTTGPDVDAVTAWLGQYTTAVTTGDVEGWADLWVEDVSMFPPDAPARVGAEDVRAMGETFFQQNTAQLTARVEDAIVAGDLAFVRAFYEETVSPKGEGEPSELRGSWFIILRKQPDGSWKMWRDMWSELPSPTM